MRSERAREVANRTIVHPTRVTRARLRTTQVISFIGQDADATLSHDQGIKYIDASLSCALHDLFVFAGGSVDA